MYSVWNSHDLFIFLLWLTTTMLVSLDKIFGLRLYDL